MKKKILIIGILLVSSLVLLQFNITGWVTRTISSSQDNKETLICNSNGNCWGATGTNIQLAIDDLTEGGTVKLPAGDLHIDSAIELRNNTRLIGSGIGASLLGFTPSGSDFFIEIENVDNVTLSDFTVNMEGKGGNAIPCWGSSDVIIQNIQIKNPGANGIWCSESSPCKRLFISGVSVYNVSEEPYHSFGFAHLKDSVVSDCIAYGQTNYPGVAIDVGGGWNCTFNNIIIKNGNGGMKITGDERTENCEFNNIVISGISSLGETLKIQNTHNTNFNNIFIEGGSNGPNIWASSSNLNFNNVIIDSPSGYGLSVSGENINANNIIIKNPGGNGLRVDGNNITLSKIQVHNATDRNQISGSNGVILSDSILFNGQDSEFGLLIQNTENLLISKCQIIENQGHGIYFHNNTGPSTDFIISDNVITGNALTGIYLKQSDHDNFIITNNIVLDNTLGGITDNSNSGANKLVGDNLT